MTNPEIHTEELALFSQPPINVAEDKISWVQYKPSFMSSGDYSSVQFTIAGNSSQYIKLSDSILYIKIRIVKEDGTPFIQQGDVNTSEAVETAVPVDLILHSMWSSVDIKLNHTLVSTSGTDYMYKAMIETLLNYSDSAKKIQLANVGFSGDSGMFDQISPLKPPVNHGLVTRYGWFQRNESSAEFMGPLMADICNQDRLILPGVDVDIKLWPTRDEFRLITNPEGLKCKVILEDIYLDICKVHVSPEVMVGHNSGLELSDALYPFQRTDIRTYNIAANMYGNTIEDIWQGEVPSRLVIGMVSSEAYSGSLDTNPYLFDHFNIVSAGFYVNGEPTPRQPVKMDVDGGSYMQGLMSLYRVSGTLMENTDIGINRDNYQQGYSLIGFDVDPTTSSDFRYIGKPRQGHTKLELRFKNATEEPITLILYATFPETMTIDQTRNVRLQVKDKLATRREGHKGI